MKFIGIPAFYDKIFIVALQARDVVVNSADAFVHADNGRC